MNATVSSLLIYPDSEHPGQELESVEMTPTGPEGNRAKKHAVHLVSAEEFVETHPKANIVLDMDASILEALVGQVVRLGECVMTVTKKPAQCAGVYAEVVQPGVVSVDDVLQVGEADAR
jgi:MOSC domain-containing protein YiiM